MNWKDFLNSLKLSIKIIVKSLILIILFSSALLSQQDTITSVRETTSTSEQNTAFVMQKSPWLAVLQSAVVPGLGQIYNESYIKAPIIWGAAALLVYGWIYNDDLYQDYRTLYQQESVQIYRTRRDFYRDQRDLFTIYLGLVYLLNLVDAYVDAHLFDFNVEEDFFTKIPMLNLKINF
jgi:hypothetical protein